MQLIEQFFEMFFKILSDVLRVIFELLELVFNKGRKNKGYNADFVSERALFSKKYAGFCLTGNRNLSVKDSYMNALVIGGTGTGKSTVTLLPSLYSMQSSFIVNDPSGELFVKSGGFLASRGYEVKTLNFANPARSCGYNPLKRAETSSDIQKVANLLVTASLGGANKDPFWNSMAVNLLSMLISILKAQPSDYHNLHNVRQLLNQMGGNSEAVDCLFSQVADEVLFAEYRSFIALDDKVVSGVLATCKAALQVFSDEAVALVTSHDSLDMLGFRRQAVALFIQTSISDQKYYSALTSILFEQFFAHILSRFPAKGEFDVFFLIDEAASLKLPTLPMACANVRKHRSGIMLVVQDFSQLIHNFGRFEADSIRSNCFAKMYYAGQSFETAKELEHALGKYQFEDDKGRTVVMPLMTNDQVRTMRSDRALLICGNNPPIIAKLKPCYEDFYYKHHAEIPPPSLQGEIPFDRVPIFPLEYIN